jgi:addiction module HigA family antidote
MPARIKPLAANPARSTDPRRREYPVRRPLKRPPAHPGALMREILEDHFQMKIADAARRMKVSRPTLYAVLNGTSAVAVEMALRFARLTGGAPALYLNMQTGHDLEKTGQRLKDELASIFPQTGVISGSFDRPAPQPPPDGNRKIAIGRPDRGSPRTKLANSAT